MTSTGTAPVTVVASPSPLRDNGQSFGVWLRALPVTYTSAFAGYVDSGGPFRFVSTTRTVPVRRVADEAALVTLGYNGGATPGRTPTSRYCPAAAPTASATRPPPHRDRSRLERSRSRPVPGDQLTVSIDYDQHGHDYFTVTDTTRHTTQTVKVPAVFYGTSGYNATDITAMINNSAVTPPPTDIQLWQFASSHVTTYSGHHGTLLGPWATSQYTDTITGTAAGATVMSASVLGRSDAIAVTRAAAVCSANRARRSSGPVEIRALAWPFVRVRSPAALRLATISARIASTAPSRPLGAPRARPDWAARAALTASSGPDLPLPAAVLAVRTAHLHDPGCRPR